MLHPEGSGRSGSSGSPAPRARSPRRELLADLEDDVDMAQDDGATQPPLLAGFLKDGMRGMDDGPGGLGFPACLDILAPAALCPAHDVQRIVEGLRDDEISALYDRYSERFPPSGARSACEPLPRRTPPLQAPRSPLGAP